MKKVYFTLFIFIFCTVTVFSSQLYSNALSVTAMKAVAPVQKDSASIISGIIALPSFR